MLVVLVSCLLGNFLDGDSCFFRHSQLFLQFRDAHFQVFLTVSQVSQYVPSSLFESDTPPSPVTATHWLSSSLDEGELCCGIGVFHGPLWARKSFGHFSLVLNVMPHSLPTFLLCSLPTLTLLSCLPRSGPFSPLCHKKLENIIASSRRVLQDVPWRDLVVFWLHQALQGLDVHF